jgi:NADPH:quinone reductase-like Zn-dependent oxidoreductase
MRALVQRGYGSADVFAIEDVEKPRPGDDEVLVRQVASSINGADVEYMRGTFFVRFSGLRSPRSRVRGTDVSGRVESVGAKVTRFAIGDEVFGDVFEHGHGAFAEYVCAPESALTPKPPGLSFEQAATIPQSAIMALQGIDDSRPVQAGQHVLVNGAGGGVGSFAIQMAKANGAEVTGVDSANKLGFVSELGADHVIDYAQEDFARGEVRYDVIMDTVASRSVSDIKRVLTPAGTYWMVGGATSRILQIAALGPLRTKGSDQYIWLLTWRANDAELVRRAASLIIDGSITPRIEHSYPLSESVQAMRTVSEGRTTGKTIITM